MKYFFLGILTYFFNQYLHSQPNKQSKVPSYPNEIMEYSLKYGVFNIGEAKISFGAEQYCPGAVIIAEARSIGFVKFIRDIHYRFQSCMDTSTGLPKVASRIIVEGDFVDVNNVFYNHTVRKDSSVVYSKETDSLVVPKNIFDILTGFYHYRSNYLNGKITQTPVTNITTFFIDEVWPLTIRYAGKEKISTKFGEIECLKLMPVTEVGRFFRTKEDMSIWVTNDGRYIPVLISANLKIGALKIEMIKYSPPSSK